MTSPHPDDLERDHGDPPWVIPVRDPSPEVLAPSTAGLGQALAVVVLGVVVFAGAMVFGGGLLVEDRDAARDTAASVTQASDPAEAEVLGDVTMAPSTRSSSGLRGATTGSSSTSSTSTTSDGLTTTTAAPPTTAETAAGPSPPDTGSVPPLPSSFDGGWVAQLSSVPQSSGTDRLEAAWRTVRAEVPGTRVAISDDWASLRPGYWVLVHAGPFDSAIEVRRFCSGVDHDCLARELVRD